MFCGLDGQPQSGHLHNRMHAIGHMQETCTTELRTKKPTHTIGRCTSLRSLLLYHTRNN
nr:MAG TPA: hypothetical protein [Caudoviricetes sp.]